MKMLQSLRIPFCRTAHPFRLVAGPRLIFGVHFREMSIADTRDERLRRLLVQKGLRLTDQRMVILRELDSVDAPISHGELTERLAHHTLDRATIYRNLLSLTEAGILVRAQLGDNVWRYEMPRSEGAAHDAHPHFVCNDCGELSCLPEEAIQITEAAREVEIAEVQVRGRCAGCVGAG